MSTRIPYDSACCISAWLQITEHRCHNCMYYVEERRTNEENMQRSEETSNLALLHHCCFFIYMLKRHYRILLAPARDHSCLSARWRL